MSQLKNECNHTGLDRLPVRDYPEYYRCKDCGRFFKIKLGTGKWH